MQLKLVVQCVQFYILDCLVIALKNFSVQIPDTVHLLCIVAVLEKVHQMDAY